MYCNNCGQWFSVGTTHWCSPINSFVYFPMINNNCRCGCKQKNPIEEKLDKIISLLEKKKK